MGWGQGEGGNGSYGLMGTELYFYKIERVLEMDGGDGSTALGMY